MPRALRRTRYSQIADGEWFEADLLAGIDLACCDCGLVHRVRWTKNGKNVLMKMTSAPRLTASLRRRMARNKRHKGAE